MKKLAILASGSGSNAEKIMEYFQNSTKAKIALVASNNADAFAPLLDICNVELPIIEFSIRPNNNRLRTRHLLSKTQIDSAPGSMNSHFLYHGFHFAPPMAIKI